MPAYSPLHDSPIPVPPRSLFERICFFIPGPGWIMASSLECKRRKPRWDFIHDQLAARTQSTEAAWGNDPVRLRIAEILSEELRNEFGWPNAHFLPDDPLPLLIWSSQFDCELLSALIAAEERLNTHILLPKIPLDRLTLGQLVDHIRAQQKPAPSS